MCVVRECALGVDPGCPAMTTYRIRKKRRSASEASEWVLVRRLFPLMEGTESPGVWLLLRKSEWKGERKEREQHHRASLAVSTRQPCTRLYKSFLCSRRESAKGWAHCM